jgi:hypothetical protein
MGERWLVVRENVEGRAAPQRLDCRFMNQEEIWRDRHRHCPSDRLASKTGDLK